MEEARCGDLSHGPAAGRLHAGEYRRQSRQRVTHPRSVTAPFSVVRRPPLYSVHSARFRSARRHALSIIRRSSFLIPPTSGPPDRFLSSQHAHDLFCSCDCGRMFQVFRLPKFFVNSRSGSPVRARIFRLHTAYIDLTRGAHTRAVSARVFRGPSERAGKAKAKPFSRSPRCAL